MKKLIFGVFAITFLSSFSNTEDVFTCYDDCDEMAWVNGGISIGPLNKNSLHLQIVMITTVEAMMGKYPFLMVTVNNNEL